ncbi:hypothetical protein BASA61_001702 [Batrachochytrium salamandrivorans]|nr:hypothetical protein BASA61_001702 [Batrachochytrium salamandrivorans]
MHLVSDAHGYPMFAKACWESIKAAYTSVSITDGMDLYRDLNKVFYDPSLGVAKLLDQMDLLRRKLAVAAVTFADPIWVSMVASKLLDGSDAWLSCRGTIKNLQPNELHPSQFRNFLLKEERVLIDARVLGMPQSCDTALFTIMFSYSSNISQLHSTYDSVFITQHTPTIKTKDTERDMAFMAIANSDDLISDSGATAHMTCRKEWLFDYTPISHYSVSTTTKEPHTVEGKGTLRLLSYHDGKAVPISITNVLYVPNYAVNLISECCLEEKGCTIESSKTNRTIYDKYGNVAFIANRHNNFNKLNRKIVIPIKGTIIKDRQDQSLAVSSTFKSPATISVWNQRLGHLSDSGIQTLTKRAQANHVKQVKSETIIPVKAIRSDNGGKFKSRDSDAFLTSKEISRQLATPHIPQQTGTAERKNQNLMDSARSMVIKSAHALRTPALITKLNSEQCNALCSDTPQVPRPIAY